MHNVNNSNNNDVNVVPFIPHMTLEEANKLIIHDKIDHRDQVGRFVYATVSEKEGTNLKIHYDGWSRKWDTWSDFNLELDRFARAGSISKRPAHRFRELKKGDYVDINPARHPGWKCGEIKRFDETSGHVHVVYESLDKAYTSKGWAHLDDVNRIAEFTSRSGTYDNAQINIMKKTEKPVQQPVQQIDEMEAFERIRAKRFPKYPNEKILNPYSCGNWLEVHDTETKQWITATVIDKENNWILVHFDGWPSKYDQKIHVLKHSKRLRDLGSGSQETQDDNSNHSKANNRKRKFEDMNEIELEPALKRIKIMNNNDDFIDYKKEIEKLKQENKTLKQRLDLLECGTEKIKAMNLNELNEFKITMQNKIKLVEEVEKELMDNSKNVSFVDGCNHMALCDKCEESLETKCCPICQIPYTKVKKINF